jgi:hypothetical protein
MMRDDFCAFILTHGRPDRVFTYENLRRCGYTGQVRLIVDDEDKSKGEYLTRYGDEVVVFDKALAAQGMDVGDNFAKRNSVIYARNVCHRIAKELGFSYFVQLDDDYQRFDYRFNGLRHYCQKLIFDLDGVFCALVDFMEKTNYLSVAMAQSGDYLGGENSTAVKSIRLGRKVMNSFVCKTDRPFSFLTRMNDDVTTYVSRSNRGELFGTAYAVSLTQKKTQANSGGLTEMYLEHGTYVKSFYTVMHSPSCVKVSEMGIGHRRLHHKINWNCAAPNILRESHRKPR